MTLVLVHGVPETPAVWEPLRACLTRSDVTSLQLPGFGCAVPEGFEPTKEGYAGWLAGELEALAADGGPVDLVGHDWGGGFVIRLVSTRPDLVRRWVTDVAGIGDVEQEWHALAKVWQTPEAGEAFFAAQLASPPEATAPVLEAAGVPLERGLEMARWLDETMAGCILTLYRSAVEVGKEWGPDFHDIEPPGLVLVPSEDPFQSGARSREVAQRAGAATVDLDGLGHWWMLQDPARVAPVIEEFLSGGAG
jgi:pimeloyl-ACP methyl ester carboxylesterase